MEKIELGDVVRLRAGGPTMTVNSVYPDNKLFFCCVWFEGSEDRGWGDYKEGVFYFESLEKIIDKGVIK